MKAMGFEEHDDPSLTHIFGTGAFPDIPKDPRDSLADLYEETEAHKRDLKINKKNLISQPALRRILTKKNFYPDIKPPTFLTWAEKQTIRNLHDNEPGEWTAKKLSECFPAATETIIKDVIKNRSPPKMNSVQAKQHDDKVRNNWKLLTQGKLHDQLGQDLYNHLITVGPKLIKEGNFSSLTTDNIRQLEETMLQIQENHSDETFCIAPQSSKGPFGSIISEYAKKVESKLVAQKSETAADLSPTVIDGKNLLIDGDVPNHRGHKYPRDPRRGTALINVNIDLSTEKPMTMDTFKEIFKDNLKENNQDDKFSSNNSSKFLQASPVHSMSKQFLKWIDTEHEKNNMTSSPMDIKNGGIETPKIISKPTKRKKKPKHEKSVSGNDNYSPDFSKSKWILKVTSESSQK